MTNLFASFERENKTYVRVPRKLATPKNVSGQRSRHSLYVMHEARRNTLDLQTMFSRAILP